MLTQLPDMNVIALSALCRKLYDMFSEQLPASALAVAGVGAGPAGRRGGDGGGGGQEEEDSAALVDRVAFFHLVSHIRLKWTSRTITGMHSHP